MTVERPPHCNQDVIHAPGECYYCDKVPELQRIRQASGTPFTPNESNGWSGNVAVKAGERHQHLGVPYVVGGEEAHPAKARPFNLLRKLSDLTKRK